MTALREEVHLLLYGYQGGFTLPDIHAMDREEREWFLQRLRRQRDAEAAAIHDAATGRG